jgi:hypothetical protein
MSSDAEGHVMAANTGIPQALSSRLRQLLSAGSSLDAAQLHLIDFDNLSRAFGPRWPDVKARIREISFDLLSRRVAPEDLIIPCTDGFLVLFGKISGQEAEAAGKRLTDDLNQFFLGQSGLEKCQFSFTHKTVQLGELAGLVRDDETPLRPPARAGRSASADSAKVAFRFKYLPIWDIKQAAITSYFVQAVTPEGWPVPPMIAARDRSTTRTQLLVHDLWALDAAQTGIEDVLGAGGRIMVGTPIHAATLADPGTRLEMLAAFDSVNPAVKKFLLGKIQCVDQGFPLYQLVEILACLKQKVERVCVVLPPEHLELKGLSLPHIWRFGLEFEFSTRQLSRGELQCLGNRLKIAAGQAHKLGKRLYVGANHSAEVIELCRSADVDYTSCLASWPLHDHPKGVSREVAILAAQI